MRPRRSPSRSPTRRVLNFDSPPPRTPSPRGRRSPARRGRNRSPESPSDFRLPLNFDSPNPQSPLSVDRPLPIIPGRVETLLNGGQTSPYRAPPRRRSPRRSPSRNPMGSPTRQRNSPQRSPQQPFDVKAYIESRGNPEDITELYLSGKNITHLEEDTFENLTRLEWLYLERNQLTTLPPKLFENLAQLKNLSLEKNQLSYLPPKLFENLARLKEMDLSGNQLSILPPKIFDNLTQLKLLYLEGNQLSYLPPKIFENLTQLEDLDLSGNQLNEIPRSIVSGVRVIGREEIEQRAQRAQAPRSPQRRTSPPRSPRRGDNQNLRELQGEISRFDPRRPPSPQEPREEYEVNCINDDDILMVDDFTKGVKEFENDQRVIILEEGTSKRGNCFGQKTLIMSMMALNNGLPTVGPWKAMNVMGDNAVNRYFKLPYPNVWVDLNGLNNILEGWKVLRLKKIKKERIGSQFAVGTLHGHEEQIYTLSKTNSKYQGKNDRVKFVLDEAEDGKPNIYFKVDDGFLHLFYQ